MKHIKFISFLLGTILFLSGCQKDTYTLNEEFSLDYDKTGSVVIDDQKIEIQFVEVVEESRCPPDVECIWEGQVAVKLIVNDIEVILGINHNTYSNVGEYKDYQITLLDVTYDKKENFSKENHSLIKIRVD